MQPTWGGSTVVRDGRQGTYCRAHRQGGTIRRANSRESRPLITAERWPALAVVSKAARESTTRPQRRLQQAHQLDWDQNSQQAA